LQRLPADGGIKVGGSTAVELTPGSVLVLPAGHPHYTWTEDAEATPAASVGDITAIVAKLATYSDGSFAVLMFDSPLSPKGDTVNLQYSVEHGAVGLDWVLLGEINIADKEKISTFAAQLGHPMTEREMNNVRYLRVEGSDLDKLGARIIVELYRIAPNAQLELITEGFDWPPKT
jgi:hypothetical protein